MGEGPPCQTGDFKKPPRRDGFRVGNKFGLRPFIEQSVTESVTERLNGRTILWSWECPILHSMYGAKFPIIQRQSIKTLASNQALNFLITY